MTDILILILAFIPTLYEAWTDRLGEQKKDKVTDAIILVIASVVMTAAAYLALDNWIAVPLFILVFRFCCFDYLVHWFLKKYSTNHPRINIWRYSGGTAYFDKLTAKVHWKIRLIARGIVFLASVAYFLLS